MPTYQIIIYCLYYIISLLVGIKNSTHNLQVGYTQNILKLIQRRKQTFTLYTDEYNNASLQYIIVLLIGKKLYSIMNEPLYYMDHEHQSLLMTVESQEYWTFNHHYILSDTYRISSGGNTIIWSLDVEALLLYT